jgi:hypothetical protein
MTNDISCDNFTKKMQNKIVLVILYRVMSTTSHLIYTNKWSISYGTVHYSSTVVRNLGINNAHRGAFVAFLLDHRSLTSWTQSACWKTRTNWNPSDSTTKKRKNLQRLLDDRGVAASSAGPVKGADYWEEQGTAPGRRAVGRGPRSSHRRTRRYCTGPVLPIYATEPRNERSISNKSL